MLDSWVVSQIWLDSDSNEWSQSRVGRENQGYEPSQSRITLIVIWVRVESKLRHFFLKRKVNILHLSIVLQGKNQSTTTFGRIPLPRSTTFGQIRWNVMSRESDLTQLWLKWDKSESSEVIIFVIWVESELSQSRKVKCWVVSELSHLHCQMIQSRISLKIWVEHNPGSRSPKVRSPGQVNVIIPANI